MLIFYAVFLVILSIYSYSLVDLNLTLINHPFWNKFRDWIIQLGYFHRDISWNIYLILLIIGFIFHFIFIRQYKKYNPLLIAIFIGVILLFSYPFLSHDLFNYLFDAKIATFYHQNPYLKMALNFPKDPWTRFMHWTNRTYPYGPSFILLTLIPSFFSFGKFILSFLFYKLLVIVLFLSATFSLSKLNKKWAMIFATNPLIIFEGLINGHNDLIALSLALIGISYFFKNKKVKAFILFILSGGIKYVTLPLIGLSRKLWINKIIFLIELVILVYMGIKMEIQPWYYLTLFIFIPYYEELLFKCNIFIFGLLVSYYPYIRLGGWDTTGKVLLKHQIIIVFLFINIAYLSIDKIVFKKMKLGFPGSIFKTKN
jgi:hypothetical protein